MVRSESPFLRPDPRLAHAGARRSCQSRHDLVSADEPAALHILWWPRKGAWKNSLWRKNARGFVFQRQLHSSVGVIGWVAFIVVSFTGVAISFPQTTTAAFHGLFGGDAPPARVARVEPLPNSVAIDADRAVAVARGAAPLPAWVR